MKIILLLLTVFSFSFITFAQYKHVTIKDIQYQNPDSLKIYFEDDKPSPLNNDTVTVTGIVMSASYQYANPDS
ncbi:MAG TPA: hypothetical protein ENI61_04510, partial [Ignavibacteria bacterium]|nr:hypothetical protein [Ignavibacteria bacterium]